MTSKHTPAPWKAVINGVGYWEVVHPWPEQSFEEANHYSPTVVHVCTKEGDEQEANARLIAAAPKLLEALKESLAALEWVVEQGGGPACEHDGGVVCFCKENNAINSARAAISKAIEQ